MEYNNLQETIKTNVNKALEKLNIDKATLGEKTGIQKTTLYSIYKNKRDFTLYHLHLISKYTGIPIYDFFNDTELIDSETHNKLIKEARSVQDKFQMVPQIESIACGHLTNLTDNDITDYKVFSKIYLNGCYKPFVTHASGDSMFPTIQEGDLVLFNRDPDMRNNPDPNKIYLLNLTPEDESASLTIKRAQVLKDSWELSIMPDNRQYPIETIQMSRQKSIHEYVLAVATWIGKELKNSCR